MSYDSDKHQRHSIRLKDYDYSQAGAYFVTTCTYNRKCLLGEVINGEMVLSEFSEVVEREWLRAAEIRPNVELDEFIIMPNHIHGIIVINESNVGATCRSPEGEGTSPLRKGPRSASIGAIIAGFKSAVTRRINDLRGTPYTPVWQRNYYEHVIRNENDLDEIRGYIINNPLKWDLDSENPNNVGATCRSPQGEVPSPLRK
jgi:REP element-mobilizing transposase RayT